MAKEDLFHLVIPAFLLKDFDRSRRCHLAVNLLPDHHRWRLTAVAETAAREEGKIAISRGLAHLDAKLGSDLLQQTLPAQGPAGDGIAEMDHLPTDGTAVDQLVEGRQLLDLQRRETQQF